MAINFPNAPVNKSTYTYLSTEYTFIQPDTNFDGYWAVLTPATVGVATPTEINAGTDNSKYTSPDGLNSSKYVREDEATGETLLKANGLERLKAQTTGIKVTGQVVLDGDVLRDSTKTGITELWTGSAGDGVAIAFADSLDKYDMVLCQADVNGTLGLSTLASAYFETGSLVTKGAATIHTEFLQGATTFRVSIGLENITTAGADVLVSSSLYSGTVTGIYGVKFA